MPRWHDLSPEPNSPEAKRFRLDTLARAHAGPVADRLDFLAGLARGKRVLDVGVVQHDAAYLSKDEWLHRRIVESAAYTLGVDILPEGITQLQQAGYNVRLCNILEEDVGERFDLMIVGEVIEHLGHPAALFQAAKRILSPGGEMVLTTPNPYYWKRIRNYVGLKRGRTDSVDHVTLLFPSGIAELAEREGLSLKQYRGVEAFGGRGRRGRTSVKRLLTAGLFHPEFFCETMLYVCGTPD